MAWLSTSRTDADRPFNRAFEQLGVGAALMVVALLAAIPSVSVAAPKPVKVSTAADIWAATWEASPEAGSTPVVLANQTVRQVARISLGGIFIRARLSNEFGDRPLTIATAHVALAVGAGAGTQPGTDRALTFGGRPSVTIPPHARVLSDPVSLTVPSLASVAVSLYLPGPADVVTQNVFSMATSYIASGDQTAAADLPGAQTITHRVILTGLDISAKTGTKVVVALGDSLTGGFGSTIDLNHRWPDHLAERLIAQTNLPPMAVVNAGIGGNRLLHDFFGPNAMSRFDRDVLAQPSVGYLIVLIGINDFGLPGGRNLPEEEVSADDVIAGYKQLIVQANGHGIKVFFGTMPPFAPLPQRPGYYSDAAEMKREAVNNWIRTNKDAQGYIDFEAALRDPKTPNRMLPIYDSADHLDPNDAGYQAMSDAVQMRLFQ
ncbi:MAG: SGNH/GDSL hydrolase family protein [Caulobacterales bacterium]